MTTQVGYGKYDIVGSPIDFITNGPFQGSTGGLVTGLTYQMNNNKLVVYASATLAALAVVLPMNAPDGAEAQIVNAVGSGTITALTVTVPTNYAGSSSTQTQNQTVSDNLIGTAVTSASTASGVAYKWIYSLNGDVTKGVGPRSWIRVA